MVPETRICARFPSPGSPPLPQLMRELLARQKAEWPACGKGFGALEKAELRTLSVEGFTVRLQWNPQRIVSTAANVDAAAIKARRCFLCLENLPPEQLGILYKDDYLILCNPSPIFPDHYTIAHTEHRPQSIVDGIGALLSLSVDMGDEYVAFYNGPRCGASAPDHLHMQAVGTGSIPAESDVRGAKKRDRIGERDGVSIWKIPFYGRTHLVLSGADTGALSDVFGRLVRSWQHVLAVPDEPMLNLLSIRHDRQLSLLVFLRSKHRPDDYFREGDDRVLVSPASVDMGGHIVTPVEKDFHALDGPYVERMYTEVSETQARLSEIVHGI